MPEGTQNVVLRAYHTLASWAIVEIHSCQQVATKSDINFWKPRQYPLCWRSDIYDFLIEEKSNFVENKNYFNQKVNICMETVVTEIVSQFNKQNLIWTSKTESFIVPKTSTAK